MKTGSLLAGSALALAIVGYAAWTLRADPGAVDPDTALAQGGAGGSRAATARRAAPGGIKTVEPTSPGDARPRPKAGPPPRPVPKVSLEQARSDFTALLQEYDALLGGNAPMSDAQWVKLYAKGAEALGPLQQHLSWEIEPQAQEMRTAQTAYRTKIDALQRLVVRPPTPQ